jgi:hypothetical protein
MTEDNTAVLIRVARYLLNAPDKTVQADADILLRMAASPTGDIMDDKHKPGLLVLLGEANAEIDRLTETLKTHIKG